MKEKRIRKVVALYPERILGTLINNPDFSVLVTGYPRTGTSTMMRELHLGGLDVIADKQSTKPHHQFDPYGSFEMENALERLHANKKTWTKGAAVKVVAPYVVTAPGLPTDRIWKAIFMLRPVAEIVSSLMAMKTVWEYTPMDAIRDCKKFLEYYSIETCFVTYAEMLTYPRGTATKVANFLDLDLNINKMVEAVSKTPREDYKGDRMVRDNKEIIQLSIGKEIKEEI